MTNERRLSDIHMRLGRDYDPPHRDENDTSDPPDMFRQAIEDVRWLMDQLRDQSEPPARQLTRAERTEAALYGDIRHRDGDFDAIADEVLGQCGNEPERDRMCKHDDGDCHEDDPCDECPKYRRVPTDKQERAMHALADQAQALDMGYGKAEPKAPRAGVTIACSGCEAGALLPYTDDTRMFVGIDEIEGWTVHNGIWCQRCSQNREGGRT